MPAGPRSMAGRTLVTRTTSASTGGTSWCGATSSAAHRCMTARMEDVLDPDNTASGVWADSAYRSAETEAKLAERGMTRVRTH